MMASGHAICVSIRSCNCQQYGLFLDSGQGPFLQEHGAVNSGCGFNNPWQQGLGAKQVRNQSEEFVIGGKGRKRRVQFHLSEVTHDLARRPLKEINSLVQTCDRRPAPLPTRHTEFLSNLINGYLIVSREIRRGRRTKDTKNPGCVLLLAYFLFPSLPTAAVADSCILCLTTPSQADRRTPERRPAGEVRPPEGV